MTITYNTGIPAATDLISNSQGQIQTNFNSINQIWGIDHYAFSSNSPAAGTHKQCTLANEFTPSSVAGAGILHSESKTYTTPSQTSSEAFWQGNGTTGSQNVQITNQSLVASSGQGMCPGGLQFRCGSGTTGTSNNVTFSPPFPVAASSLVATTQSSGTQVNVTSLSASNATVAANGGGAVAFYWIAIGY